MLPWSLHWFRNLFVTLGGRVAGRDNGLTKRNILLEKFSLSALIISLHSINLKYKLNLTKKIILLLSRIMPCKKTFSFYFSQKIAIFAN